MNAVKETHALWKLVCDFTPRNSKEQNLQSSMLTTLTQSFDLRRFRITSGRHGLPRILCAVLICCSIITVVCTYFLAAESLLMHGQDANRRSAARRAFRQQKICRGIQPGLRWHSICSFERNRASTKGKLSRQRRFAKRLLGLLTRGRTSTVQ